MHPGALTLDLYRLNQLRESDAREVSNHLNWCQQCRRSLFDARDLAQLIKRVVEHGAVADFTEQDSCPE